MSNVKISQLNGGTNRTPVKANNPQIEYEEGGVSYPCKITDALDFYKAASASLGSVASFNLTGLDTVNFDYDLSVRLKRSAGGVAADYLTIQFGDTGGTPTWFTGGLFLTPLGANSAGLTTSGGITRVAQVQNNATLAWGQIYPCGLQKMASSSTFMVTAICGKTSFSLTERRQDKLAH
jgi:hypothetical protein